MKISKDLFYLIEYNCDIFLKGQKGDDGIEGPPGIPYYVTEEDIERVPGPKGPSGIFGPKGVAGRFGIKGSIGDRVKLNFY